MAVLLGYPTRIYRIANRQFRHHRTTSRVQARVKQQQTVMLREVWSATSEHFIKLIKNNVITRTHWRISGGEPLLVFDTWREFPPYMKKVLGNRFMAGTISNFTLLNDDMIRYFVENKIGCGVSLDGTVHSKIDINGNSTSKKVMENIEWFLDEGGRCNILTVLTDTNVETGEIFLELAKFVVKHDSSHGR